LGPVPGPGATDPELIVAARAGDEGAFERLLAPHRRELYAHCYRMLGSTHDAEDALQDALLRVWRGLGSFEDRGGGALRAWLYRIATNASLDLIGRRRRRLLPPDYGGASDPSKPPGDPVGEAVWLEPFAEETVAVADAAPGPEETLEERESLELAFVAALQQLPARQRAVLILREVLGFSAKEVGETLDTSVQSVNSALQRARKVVDDRVPERSQTQTLRELGDQRTRAIVEAYMEAMGRSDVPRVVSMLTADVAWTMPPLASWYGGIESVEGFLRGGPLSGEWDWRHRAAPLRPNGQLAVGTYTVLDGVHLPFSLDVLTLRGERIAAIDAFVVRVLDSADEDGYSRWPDFAVDPERVESVFRRFGLPDRLA
jgi:RNA polymerase sigma-70 factor (ECF subfamily)